MLLIIYFRKLNVKVAVYYVTYVIHLESRVLESVSDKKDFET